MAKIHIVGRQFLLIINLIKNREMFFFTLPEKVKGQYWITDYDKDYEPRRLLRIEAIDKNWHVKCNEIVKILDNENRPKDIAKLSVNSFYNLYIKDENERAILYAESKSSDRTTYSKLVVKNPVEISIGRNKNCQIVYENDYVSREHCRLIFDGNKWSIIDKNSINGTFVNGLRVDSKNLVPGDFIFIMGLRIVIGGNFIAINNPDGKVVINSDCFSGFIAQKCTEKKYTESVVPNYFYRSPRFKKKIESAVIKIDAPPTMQKPEETPLALTLGPSLTMGIASLSTAVMSIINFSQGEGSISSIIPTSCMSLSMLAGAVVWPILIRKHSKKLRFQNEQKRQQKYLAYLDSIRDEIKKYSKEQTDILNENITSNKECADRITMVKRSLWERSIGQDDFLSLRLGIGELPLFADIKYPEKKFTLDEDSLQEAMLSLGEEKKVLTNVPISMSLVDNFISGIVGDYESIINLTKSLILQIVSLHSYDEVKLILIADEDSKKQWDFVKFVPHFWSNDKSVRTTAFNLEDVKELSLFIETEIIDRISGNKDISDYNPYYVIISLSKELSDKCDGFKQLLEYSKNSGFSIISVHNELKDLPIETSTVVLVNGNNSKIFNKNDISGESLRFSVENVNPNALLRAADVIANIELDISSGKYSLPNMITFMEMFNVSKIEHLNCLTRWKESNPVASLQTPVGVDTQGDLFYLDLHEKYHGPHGLVAGMTGSGKSEFIITYILSLAINYHPDEVAFILIDYKGGGLAGAFEDDEREIKLPHLAGTITNLDGAAVKRSLVSIQSELRRRQGIFNEARKISNEGTMDIYKYQQLYRNGVVNEPIPHLFIISDEFAELKAQQPEFMEQLISAARIGRSLGVHLILATQKPSGVVDDQIWSNSKFRVCLKVQDKADSQEMIKCPDAASISQTGRFYLQVGFNELFALGQSAWCGAEYVPTDTVEKTIDESIEIIDNMGYVVRQEKPEKKRVSNGPETKQIVAIVKYLSELATEENISVRPLWLKPIPARIVASDIEKKYNYKTEKFVLNPVVGEYDDPFNQNQNILTLPLSSEGNCLVYGASGNGKTTFMTTLAHSLVRNYSVEELNLYIMDFGAETLKAYENAPAVGGVVTSSDAEKVNNLFKLLRKEFDSRRQLFADFGGAYSSYIKSGQKSVPNIVVLINNYVGFSEQFETLEETFGLLTRDGTKYGIYFVVSLNTSNAMRYRYIQNFKQVCTMQLNDSTEYSLVVGRTDGLIPSKFKGRGLVLLDKVYEFQTAICADVDDQYEYIRAYCKEQAENSNSFAKRIPVLPDFVKCEDVADSIGSIESIPLGIESRSINAAVADVKAKYIYPVVSSEIYVMQNFAQEFSKVVGKLQNCRVDIIDPLKWVNEETGRAKVYSSDFNNIAEEIYEDVLKRNNGYKANQMDEAFFDDFEERLVIIYGVEKFFALLNEDCLDKICAAMFKGEALYKVHFIVFDTATYFSSVTYADWFKTHVKPNEGVYVGDGFNDQYVLKTNKLDSAMYEEIGDNFGYVIRKGKAVLTKLLTSEVE